MAEDASQMHQLILERTSHMAFIMEQSVDSILPITTAIFHLHHLQENRRRTQSSGHDIWSSICSSLWKNSLLCLHIISVHIVLPLLSIIDFDAEVFAALCHSYILSLNHASGQWFQTPPDVQLL